MRTKNDHDLSPDYVHIFNANVVDDPVIEYKLIGHFDNRGEADDAAKAMARSVPFSTWDACLDGPRFAIRRVR